MLWKQELEGLWGYTCSLERSHLLHFYVWPQMIWFFFSRPETENINYWNIYLVMLKLGFILLYKYLILNWNWFPMLNLTWLSWLFNIYTWIKGTWRHSVIAALHHCHLVLILSAYSTCRFAERLFLFLFSLVIFCVWQNSCAKNVLESTYTSSVWT